ncbi:hypothetical protein GJ744_009118 [Endocarpon pusillum]|uniref:Uncharacterized protein n=1 Tax=Endocarpon pusillum TaxID=364733 RepID=A0A8H7E2X5_9EURO|nr:hypothetical protein GJ744_009118 [Endocarpon pusillum]
MNPITVSTRTDSAYSTIPASRKASATTTASVRATTIRKLEQLLRVHFPESRPIVLLPHIVRSAPTENRLLRLYRLGLATGPTEAKRPASRLHTRLYAARHASGASPGPRQRGRGIPHHRVAPSIYRPVDLATRQDREARSASSD